MNSLRFDITILGISIMMLCGLMFILFATHLCHQHGKESDISRWLNAECKAEYPTNVMPYEFEDHENRLRKLEDK